MVQKKTIALIDDLDGSPAVETVKFGLDGRRRLEIDLSRENAERLRTALAPFIEKARLVAGRRPPQRRTDDAGVPAPNTSGRAKARGKVSRLAFSPAVREWAREQGIQVADRGRMSDEVIRAYRRWQAKGRHR